jgi:hypothetical protein
MVFSLYGVCFVKGVPQGVYLIFLTSVSLFDLKARFFAPTHTIDTPARAGAVKAGRPFGGHRKAWP